MLDDDWLAFFMLACLAFFFSKLINHAENFLLRTKTKVPVIAPVIFLILFWHVGT